MSAIGKIIKTESSGSDFIVYVEISQASIDPLNLEILVSGPTALAPEQARKKLRALGSDLAFAFDKAGTLI